MLRKFVRRRTIVVAALPVVTAAVVVAIAGGSGAGTTSKGATQAFGIARASSAGSTASNVSAAAAATAGPQVINGQFQGASPAVSTLPVLPVVHAPLKTNQIESLKPGNAPPGAKDPVVQKDKGSGPLSGPIQNFDGICLPFGPPCALPSSGSCVAPDADGEVGATQYVQMVTTDSAV